MKYKYDLHVHCKEGSPCGKDSVVDIVRAYKKGGYTGFVLTDHYTKTNIKGNDKESFAAQVRNQIKAFETAKAEGDRIGLDVFFGIEFRYKSYDFLVYNVSEEFLLENEDIFDISFKEVADRIHNVGGFICQAHPFRYDGRNPISIFTPFIDAIEVYNGSHVTFGSPYPPVYNKMAQCYADGMGLIGLAGSDTHDVDKRDGTPLRKASVLFDEKLRDIPHMLEQIHSGRYTLGKEEI